VESISVNRFRDNLKSFAEQVVREHIPLRVTRRNGTDFVVVSAEDWERDQETLYGAPKYQPDAPDCRIEFHPYYRHRIHTHLKSR